MSGPTAHAVLGASNAHRWLYCTGSVAAIAALPIGEEKTSVFAEEGTRAHDLAERILRGEEIVTSTDPVMHDFVMQYVNYVETSAIGSDAMLIEERVDYSDWIEGGFGTADAIIIKGDTLHVCDLKYGMGVKVDAEDNPQGMLYGLGAYALTEATHDIKTIKIAIIQPRLDHVSEWSISASDLLRWAEWAKQRAEATQEPDAERSPGEKACRWCEAKPVCGALRRATEAALMADFEDLDSADNPDTLTDAQLREALDKKKLIEGWLSAVEAHVTGRLASGEGFDGYKLVEGRSLRQWANVSDASTEVEDRLIELFGDDAYTRKLVTPSQAEKKLGAAKKKEIADLIIKPAGKPTLAPVSDKRPAINPSIDDFDVV